MHQGIERIPTLIDNQGNSPTGNRGRNDLFGSFFKLVHFCFYSVEMGQTKMSKGQFVFKCKPGSIHPNNTSWNGYFGKIYDVSHPIVWWFPHNGLTIQNILPDPIVEHAL